MAWWRTGGCSTTRPPARGVPSHITLLGPFLPPDQVGSGVVERLRSLFASSQPVTFNLVSVERLSGLVYLSPEPVTPFRLLTEMLEREWPEAPRFGSALASEWEASDRSPACSAGGSVRPRPVRRLADVVVRALSPFPALLHFSI
jgi:hypothetical protein